MPEHPGGRKTRADTKSGVPWFIALSALLISLASLAVSAYLYQHVAHGRLTSTQIVALQMAGSWSLASTMVNGHGTIQQVVRADFPFFTALAFGLGLACWLGRRVSLSRAGRQAGGVGVTWAVAALATNAAQDVLLWHLFARSAPGNRGFLAVQALAFAKFALFAGSGAIALCGLCTAAVRLFKGLTGRRTWGRGRPGRNACLIPPPPREQPFGWEVAAEKDCSRSPLDPALPDHWAADCRIPPGRPPGSIGICLSGGGVRAGTVALGALQFLQDKGVLARARYLVSVSGGGYMAGAFQQTLAADRRPPPEGLKLGPDQAGPSHPATPANVYAPGSVEEDYTRRHSDYLADSPRQWAVALGGLLFRLLCSLALIALVAASAGMALAGFYRGTRIVQGQILAIRPSNLPYPAAPELHATTDLDAFRAKFLVPCARALHLAVKEHLPFSYCHVGPVIYQPRAGVLIALGVAAVLTLGVYCLALWWPSLRRGAAQGFLVTGGLLAVIGLVIPLGVWFSAWITWHFGHATPKAEVVAGTGSVGAAYVGTLAAAFWHKGTTVAKSGTGFFGAFQKRVSGLIPNSMVQLMLMWISLLVVLGGVLLAAGWVAAGGPYRWWWEVLPIVVLAGAAATIDQTAMSLHPFYRRRLASAFALRRVHRRGVDLAEAYPYQVLTPLSEFGSRPGESSNPGFPQVIFQASANITGQDRTPPGRRAVAYTLSSDYVGGPEVGWVKTTDIEDLAGRVIGKDLTVQAAVAISGAAFASAMGSQTRFYELFLALSNARLGAWLPNPYYVWLKQCRASDWTVPGLPSRRRLSYFAREIFGLHPSTNPLLLCTDGGHYENLGLVELLRHRCRLIFCIDATGDTPPMARTLAQAITIAREELGVEIELKDPLGLVAGSATPLAPASPLSALNDRLSTSVVCLGTITYPEEVSYEGSSGKTVRGYLVFAKALLSAGMPYELLSYSMENTWFPRDSTGDQFFDSEQFDGYQALGRYMATEAVAAATRAGIIDRGGCPVFATDPPLP